MEIYAFTKYNGRQSLLHSNTPRQQVDINSIYSIFFVHLSPRHSGNAFFENLEG